MASIQQKKREKTSSKRGWTTGTFKWDMASLDWEDSYARKGMRRLERGLEGFMQKKQKVGEEKKRTNL